MAFVKKIWKDRISQFPNRRTINDGYVTKQVTVGRDEGAVTEEGTPFDATEMNDLENRIYAAIEEGGGGGGGAGTYDYTELFNKPRINNHELNGNKSLGDLGIASNANELPIESGSATTTKDYIDTTTYTKAEVDNKFTATTEWKTSTTSFVDACSKIGIYAGIGNVLDNLKTNISSYTGNSINSRIDSTQGPVYFMWFGKASDQYFTGILLTYFGNNEPTRKAVVFSYFTGTYQVRLL